MTWIIAQSRLGDDVNENMYAGFEDNLIKNFEKWQETTVHTKAYLFTLEGLIQAFTEDIDNDLQLIGMAILLIGLYAFLFLGSFSPIHCRCLCALAALVCVLFAYTSGFGFMYMCGMKTTGVHQMMPFLLIAIGIDDVFVLCNSVDQTALD